MAIKVTKGKGPNQYGINHALEVACAHNQEKIVELILKLPTSKKPSQTTFNNALKIACGAGNQAIAKLLLGDKDRSPNKAGINEALQSACSNGKYNSAELLIDVHQNIRPDKKCTETAIRNACRGGHKEIAEWLLSLPQDIRPNSHIAIDGAFESACGGGHKPIAEWLINLPMGTIEEQYGNSINTNLGLEAASVNGYKAIVEWLLSLPQDTRPKDHSVLKGFSNASKHGHHDIVRLLLDTQEDIRSNKQHISKALSTACRNGHTEVARVLLNLPESVKPKRQSIIAAYREAAANDYDHILAVLRQHLPQETVRQLEQELQPEGFLHGRAFEIHNYAKATITSPNNGKSAKLMDAVFQHIQERLEVIKPLPYQDAQKIIENAIKEFISQEKQNLAIEAAFSRLESDTDYETNISLAVTFIHTFHPDQMQLWIKGFIEESIEAYKGSQDSVSCTKGIKERIGTGLRKIDDKLNKLFAQAEGPLLVRNWLNTWNLYEINDANKLQVLADQLKAQGINEHSTAAQAAETFRKIAQEQAVANGVQDNKGVSEEIATFADDVVEAYYEKLLRYI